MTTIISNIGIGVWAFIIYLAFIIIWNVTIKRPIYEAMLIGWVIVCAFNGFSDILTTLASTLHNAASAEIFLATMLFIVMAAIMQKTDIIEKLVGILNSLIGKLRGGAAYVSTIASALFGLVSGNSVANAATVGTITIPWMKETGWPKEQAAIINAGNGGSGQSFPASSAMFLMLGLPQIAAVLTIDSFYVSMLTAGLWVVLYRLLVVTSYVRKYDVPAYPANKIQPFGEVIQTNWKSLFMFIAIVVPLIITISPFSNVLKAKESFGEAGVKSISIVMWVPILMIIFCLIYGRKTLPQSIKGWKEFISNTKSNFLTVGGVFLFAMAGSEALNMVGFGEDLNALIQAMNLPKFATVFLVGIFVALVAGPLSGVATTVATGPVAYAVLTSVGVSPARAVAAFLIWMSTEGASPPSSAPIFISCGLAEVEDVQVTFKPLIFHYVIPIVCVGALIALGVLPIANG